MIVQSEKIILMSISPDQLENLIRDAVRSELSKQKEKKLMNFNETIQFLGISRSTLNNWKAQGRLPFKKLGKRIFFSREEVLSSLKETGCYNKLKQLQIR